MQYIIINLIRKITVGENLHWKSKISISMSSSIMKCQKDVRRRMEYMELNCFLSIFVKIEGKEIGHVNKIGY